MESTSEHERSHDRELMRRFDNDAAPDLDLEIAAAGLADLAPFLNGPGPAPGELEFPENALRSGPGEGGAGDR